VIANSTSGPSVVTAGGSVNTTGNGPFAITVTTTFSVGDVALIGCVSTFTTAYSLAITDSGSNTWTYPTSGGANSSQQYLNVGQGLSLSMAYAKITSALTSGTGTVTYTSGTFALAQCQLWDITNPQSTVLDQIASSQATFGTTVTSSSITPSLQPEIAFGLFGYSTAGGASFSAYGNVIGSAATAGSNSANVSDTSGLVMEYRRITATTAGTASTTVTGASVTGLTMFFTIESN
jgi:hypothetical protein